MTLVLCTYAIYYKYYGTAQGLHSPDLYYFRNYLPIIAPDYHPFVIIKGMYCLLIWIFLPNTYHFEIVSLPDTIHEILFHSMKCR